MTAIPPPIFFSFIIVMIMIMIMIMIIIILLCQTAVPESGRYEWKGEQYGDDLKVFFKERPGRTVYIRNMEVDVCCCSK